jgi:trehalose-phosphatase
VNAGAPVRSQLDQMIASFAVCPRLLVCCDFDGTISMLAEEPSAARPIDGAVAVLEGLANLPNTWAAIISGRALIDLTQLAGVPDNVHLIGSHGTEFEVGRILAVSPREGALVGQLAKQCRSLVLGVPGVVVEVKPGSVAVHVRKAARDVAERILTEVQNGPGSLAGVHVIIGKEVIELAVFAGNKADALDVLRARWDITGILFAGDDVTDEFAFTALGSSDAGVKVGQGPSAALWRVEDPLAVVGLLERLLALRQTKLDEGGG